MNGILLLDKPKGMTSHDCVDRIRKILKTKKVGHTGTLDPDTTGLLPLCINKATKIVPYLTAESKEYLCRIRIGYSTTTEDQSGEEIDRKVVPLLDMEKVDVVLKDLLHLKEQVPPMYSAVKINGKKLYEYAREGIEIERPARPMQIIEVKRTSDVTYVNDCAEFDFKIKGSKGFYVRTICVTIGASLGYPAHMAELDRLSSGHFLKENSYTFEQVEQGEFTLVPIMDALQMPKIEVDELTKFRVMNGSVLENKYEITEETILFKDDATAIYAPHPTKDGMIKPVKVI